MSSNSRNNSTIAKNSILLSLRMIVVLFLMLYTTRVLLTSLGVSDYGVYNVVCGFVSMFSFLTTSLSNGIQRFFNFELGRHGQDGARIVYNAAIRIQLLIAVFLIILTEGIGIWYISSKMVLPADRVFAAKCIFQASLISLLFTVIQAPFVASIMAHERMNYFAIVTIIDAVLKLLIAKCIVGIHSDSLIVYGWLLAAESAFVFLLYYGYAKHSFSEIKLTKGYSTDTFISILSFSGWNVFGSFANIMKEQGINLVLNLFFGPIANAARGVASQVNGGLQSLVSNLTIAVRPQVVQSYAVGDIPRSINLTFSISKLSCCFLFLVSFPIILEIHYILHIWLGGEVPPFTASFIYIIIITSFVNNLNAAISGLVHASGRMRTYQLVCGGITLLSVPLAYGILSLGHPPYWALIMSLLATTLAQVAALFVLKAIVDYSILDYLKRVVLPLFFVIAVSIWIPLVIHFFMAEGPYRLLAVLASSIVCSLAAIYTCGLNKSEKSIVFSMIKKGLRNR